MRPPTGHSWASVVLWSLAAGTATVLVALFAQNASPGTYLSFWEQIALVVAPLPWILSATSDPDTEGASSTRQRTLFLAVAVQVASLVLLIIVPQDNGSIDAPKTGSHRVPKQPDLPKKDDAKRAAGDIHVPDAKTNAGADPGGEKHFDISADKSGIIARSAAALETEGIDSEALRELSHHAEKLTSVEGVCRHVGKIRIRGTGDDINACVKETEHRVVKLGPEIYGQLAHCLMDAKTVEQIDDCEAAEKEVEALLHEKAHGDRLDEATCDSFFTHFEKLAMEDAKDQAELVKEILEEVKGDVVASCVDQGTKAEIDCAMKAKTMGELKDCASKLL